MLIVNVASECGFTPQYEGLEALYQRYKERGFTVLGFPCNQFGAQEPGSEAIKWNFTKFLIDREGKVIKRLAPSTSPKP